MCAYTCVHTIVLILSSQPTQPLWWSIHVLCMVLWGRNWVWGFLRVTKTLGVVVARLPRSRTDSPLHHRTKGINHQHHHLTKTGIHTQEVSCIANGCSRTPWLHVHSPCVPGLLIAVAGRTQRTPRSHISSSMTPYELDWQAVCLFSCSRRVHQVHFLCSLCFRP